MSARPRLLFFVETPSSNVGPFTSAELAAAWAAQNLWCRWFIRPLVRPS